jgi:hypothetical protein
MDLPREMLEKLKDIQADMLFEPGTRTALQEKYDRAISELRKTGCDIYFSLEGGELKAKTGKYIPITDADVNACLPKRAFI